MSTADLATTISVVIPTYNSGRTVARTLASIDQVDAEIIVVDDRSTDIETLRAIVTADARVRLIEKTIKTNAADSRAIGSREAVNDRIFFLDSDDRFEPGHIKRRLDIFDRSDAAAIFGRFQLDDGEQRYRFAMPAFEQQDIAEYIFATGGDCRSSTICIDRRKLGEVSFDRSLAQHQDWAFVIAVQNVGAPIAFDGEAGVIIDIVRPARMSARADISASTKFLDKYLVGSAARVGFLLGRIKASIKLGDRPAATHFYRLLWGETRSLRIRGFAFAVIAADRIGLTPLLRQIAARRR